MMFNGIVLSGPCPRNGMQGYCKDCDGYYYASYNNAQHSEALTKEGKELIAFIKAYGHFSDADHGHSF